ncbi:hypothetical protein [Thiobacillus sedimenti]|uniref:Uncharacterized protein n=1 Tax=Thiobacillus sedimenti TaxID=3110231 RepID=A0ABZ1CGE3_9PROT|nr:hypothetical protein [Thiobacillus sp. SCUT-2]WRS38108.1 hypothetical protein VA613_08770 [Thiobacillus sp. SCUT-2]
MSAIRRGPRATWRMLSLLGGLLLALPAPAWQVGEFRNGMSRAEVERSLGTWNFDKVVAAGNDGLFAYDLPTNPAGRRFLFSFCNDKLVAFEQEVEPSFRHFVVIASNYANLYGNPLQVIPYSSVIASGEKNLLAMFWRKGSDYVGVKYVLYPASEELSMTWQISNNCWQAPR